MVLMYLEHDVTIFRWNAIFQALNHRRTHFIDPLIRRVHNDDLPDADLRLFREIEFAPFLELCIRLLVIPMSTQDTADAIVTQSPPDNTDKGALKHPWIHVLSKSESYVRYTRKGKYSHTVTIRVEGSVALYLWINDIINMRLNNGSRQNTLFPSFRVRGKNKRQKVASDVQRYVTNMLTQVDTEWLGLVKNLTNYTYMTQFLWCMYKTHVHSRDIFDVETLAQYMYQIGTSTALQEFNVNYVALEQMHRLRHTLVSNPERYPLDKVDLSECLKSLEMDAGLLDMF